MGQAPAVEFHGTSRFELRHLLGEGGMGVVYEALDREQHTCVALKTLQRMSGEALLRFKTEFRALADLAHPNLVGLGELIEDAGQWFFTMELVRGVPFLDYVRIAAPPSPESEAPGSVTPITGSGQPVPSADEIATLAPGEVPLSRERPVIWAGPVLFDEAHLREALGQLAEGLLTLHAAQKVHRDIKPSNLLVTSAGRVVILDFGVVAEMSQQSWSGLEENGIILGTPAFMSPEQAAGRSVGPASDWYSVGVLLYLVLTGRLPFGGSLQSILAQKQVQEPIPADSFVKGLPEDLRQLCANLLRLAPRRRATGQDVLLCTGRAS